MVGTSLPRVMLTSVLMLVHGLSGLAIVPAVWAESRGARLENPKPGAVTNQASHEPRAEFVAAQTGNSWAVVIGINEYQDPKIPRLKYAAAGIR